MHQCELTLKSECCYILYFYYPELLSIQKFALVELLMSFKINSKKSYTGFTY